MLSRESSSEDLEEVINIENPRSLIVFPYPHHVLLMDNRSCLTATYGIRTPESHIMQMLFSHNKRPQYAFVDNLALSDQPLPALPEGILRHNVSKHIKKRLVAEFDIHPDEVKQLINNIYSEWNGIKIANPLRQNSAMNELKNHLVGIHKDVGVETNSLVIDDDSLEIETWHRVKTYEPEVRNNNCCVIL